jgi:hypothetical protein
MRFEVLGGTHNHYGTIYKKGEILESDRDLTKVFRGKFKKVEASTPVSKGEVFNPLDVVVNPQPPVEDDKPSEEPTAPKTPEDEKNGAPAADSLERAEGKDVTKDFQEAIDEEVRVFQKGAWYNVYDGAAEDLGHPLNDKGLRKKDVSKFIKKWADQ